MGMTLGDVGAVIGALIGVGASWAAMLILVVLAFSSRTAQAQAALVRTPGRCILNGTVILLLGGGLALVLANLPGPVRIFSFALVVILGGLAAIGGGGLVRLISERVAHLGSEMSPFATLTRSAILYVAAGFLPLFGWFLITPVALLAGLGSGYRALRAPASPPLPPVQDTSLALTNGSNLDHTP